MNNSVTIKAPASKSLSHRAVIAAALAEGESRLSGILESEDLTRTMEVMEACGASITRKAAGEFAVSGFGGPPTGSIGCGETAPLSCFVGESGTSCRLLTAVLAAGRGRFRVHGSGRLHDRPIGELAETLISLGTAIHYEGKAGCPPLVIDARGLDSAPLAGGFARIGCGESSQYLSGLLLAAPLGTGLNILLGGDKTVSWPYVSLTLQTLEDFGVPFEVETLDPDKVWKTADWRRITHAVPGATRFLVQAAPYQPRSAKVEGDYSSASYFLAAGAIGPRAVTVRGLARESLQGDAAILDILARMGADVSWQGDAVTVSPAPLKGITVDMGNCPDLAPTVAVLGAAAKGVTRIRNAAHLRAKESDRLEAPAQELRKVGCIIEVTEDGLSVSGPERAPQGRVLFSCHNDHRISMSLALLELNSSLEVAMDDPACVAKSFPDFWSLWRQVCPGSRAGSGVPSVK